MEANIPKYPLEKECADFRLKGYTFLPKCWGSPSKASCKMVTKGEETDNGYLLVQVQIHIRFSTNEILKLQNIGDGKEEVSEQRKSNI